jgi:hypothetical protein
VSFPNTSRQTASASLPSRQKPAAGLWTDYEEYRLRARDLAWTGATRSVAARALAAWHLCSLDAPTVAVVWSAALAWATGVRVPAWILAMQALAVWAVYVGDRLLDARSGLRAGTPEQLRERHFFHWRHRRVLAPLAAMAACAAAALIFAFMTAAARERSSVLAGAALLYFAQVHGAGWSRRGARGPGMHGLRPPWLTKEMLVGALFAAGCALPAVGRVHGAAARDALLCAVGFFALLAWLNCVSIERWEGAGRNGERFRAGWMLACVGVALAAGWIAAGRKDEPHIALLLLVGALSAGLLAALDRGKDRMDGVTLRAAADAVLLTPLLLLLWGWVGR